jgi:hypothetical protein
MGVGQREGPRSAAPGASPAEPGTRLCENPEFWHFCRRKLLFPLRAISENLSFHTVWH